jgi:hypothetical protein
MLYFGLVIMIYAYFNKNIKQLNELFKINFKKSIVKFKNRIKITKKVIWFSKDHI